MRFVSFDGVATGAPEWGILTAAGVVHTRKLGADTPPSLFDLISSPDWAAQLPGLAAHAAQAPAEPLSAFKLLPVLPNPGKVICLGVYYIDHAQEGGNSIDD